MEKKEFWRSRAGLTVVVVALVIIAVLLIGRGCEEAEERPAGWEMPDWVVLDEPVLQQAAVLRESQAAMNWDSPVWGDGGPEEWKAWVDWELRDDAGRVVVARTVPSTCQLTAEDGSGACGLDRMVWDQGGQVWIRFRWVNEGRGLEVVAHSPEAQALEDERRYIFVERVPTPVPEPTPRVYLQYFPYVLKRGRLWGMGGEAID